MRTYSLQLHIDSSDKRAGALTRTFTALAKHLSITGKFSAGVPWLYGDRFSACVEVPMAETTKAEAAKTIREYFEGTLFGVDRDSKGCQATRAFQDEIVKPTFAFKLKI